MRSHYSLSLAARSELVGGTVSTNQKPPRGRWKGETFLGWLVKYKPKNNGMNSFLAKIFGDKAISPTLALWFFFWGGGGIPKEFQPKQIQPNKDLMGLKLSNQNSPKIPLRHPAWCNWITWSDRLIFFHQRRLDGFFLSKCRIWRDRYFVYQGSLYYQQCIAIREIPQNHHTCVLFDSPENG